MASPKLLILALELDKTAPGIVFSSLISRLENATVLELDYRQKSWDRQKRSLTKRAFLGHDRRFARRSYKKYIEQVRKGDFDKIISFVSNGFYASIDLGYLFKQELGLEWTVYSVDGIPSPIPWFDGSGKAYDWLCSHLSDKLASADKFISSNPLMMEYQKRILKRFGGSWDYIYTPFKELSCDLSVVKHESFNIIYTGSLYGIRSISGLLEAFKRFLSIRPDAELIFAGYVQDDFRKTIQEQMMGDKIRMEDFRPDVEHHYRNADILLDIAADIPNDVFMSSKVIAYLQTGIPIVCISGENSPVRHYFRDASSIFHAANDAEEIVLALESAMHCTDFSERTTMIRDFTPKHAAERLMEIVNKKEEVVVSLTSWAPRYRNLPSVIGSILAQTRKADRIVINIDENDPLPEDVRLYLTDKGVEINLVPNNKVYKKILPTLCKYPDAAIISIDDDWIYPEGMIEDFMEIHRQHPHDPISGNRETIFGHNCHCGCASLVKASYFGKHLKKIDDEVIRFCPSDDVAYTFLALKNGHRYIHSNGLYFDNMTSLDSRDSYSNSLPDEIPSMSWDYLEERFGLSNLRVLVLVHIEHNSQIRYYLNRLSCICDCDWSLAVCGPRLLDSVKSLFREVNEKTVFIEDREGSADLDDLMETIRIFDIKRFDYVLRLDAQPDRYNHKFRDNGIDLFLKSRTRFKKILEKLEQSRDIGILQAMENKTMRFCIPKARWSFIIRTQALCMFLPYCNGSGRKNGMTKTSLLKAIRSRGFKSISMPSDIRTMLSTSVSWLAQQFFTLDRFGPERHKYLIILGFRFRID